MTMMIMIFPTKLGKKMNEIALIQDYHKCDDLRSSCSALRKLVSHGAGDIPPGGRVVTLLPYWVSHTMKFHNCFLLSLECGLSNLD